MVPRTEQYYLTPPRSRRSSSPSSVSSSSRVTHSPTAPLANLTLPPHLQLSRNCSNWAAYSMAVKEHCALLGIADHLEAQPRSPLRLKEEGSGDEGRAGETMEDRKEAAGRSEKWLEDDRICRIIVLFNLLCPPPSLVSAESAHDVWMLVQRAYGRPLEGIQSVSSSTLLLELTAGEAAGMVRALDCARMDKGLLLAMCFFLCVLLLHPARVYLHEWPTYT